MMHELSLHLDILPPPQRRLWGELSQVPREFVLYGGTALALRLGHRISVDFDFFGSKPVDPSAIEKNVGFLSGAKVPRRDRNTLTAIVDRDGPVLVSFFGVPGLRRLAAPSVVEENGLQIASLLDLAGTKASVVQMRAEAKDYLDLDALMRLGKIDLATAVSAAEKIYGSTFNPEITLKALSYFDDGNLRDLPESTKWRLATAARNVDLDRLPSTDQMLANVERNRDTGLGL